jgi:hypothetical protein
MRHHIFSGEFWRDFWVSIRRAKRDSRDRKAILRFLGIVLFSVLYYGRIIWVSGMESGDKGTLFLYGIFASCAAVAMVGIWISNKFDERTARLESNRSVDQAVRRRLSTDGFALSVLLARAGSEQMLREKELPHGVEVITRRSHIDQLKKLDLWNSLPGELRTLLLMPDGHWPEDVIQFPNSFETIRCLRWILRIDTNLQALTYFPKMNYTYAQQLVDKPERLLSEGGMVDIWDIRVERNHADAFFSRCYAEAIGRGIMSNADSETQTWAIQTFNSARDVEIRDVLVGYETISELDEGTLRYMFGISFQRYRCLQLIMDLIDGVNRWDDWTTLCFPKGNSPKSTEK